MIGISSSNTRVKIINFLFLLVYFNCFLGKVFNSLLSPKKSLILKFNSLLVSLNFSKDRIYVFIYLKEEVRKILKYSIEQNKKSDICTMLKQISKKD